MSRPQIQEEAVVMLADELQRRVRPDGLAVVMEADHFCMHWRGSGHRRQDEQQRDAGAFLKDANLRREFLSLMHKPRAASASPERAQRLRAGRKPNRGVSSRVGIWRRASLYCSTAWLKTWRVKARWRSISLSSSSRGPAPGLAQLGLVVEQRDQAGLRRSLQGGGHGQAADGVGRPRPHAGVLGGGQRFRLSLDQGIEGRLLAGQCGAHLGQQPVTRAGALAQVFLKLGKGLGDGVAQRHQAVVGADTPEAHHCQQRGAGPAEGVHAEPPRGSLPCAAR